MTASSDAETPGTASQPRELDPTALRALAHPLRVDIYDTLSQYGPHTATMLAERLGESSGATSYHLRALAKHDLIREVADKGTGRERWWERRAGAVTLTSAEGVRTPAGRAATQIVVGELYRRRNEQLSAFLSSTLKKDPEDWDGVLSSSTVRMTRAQQEEFSAGILALIEDAVAKYRDQEGEGVRVVSINAEIFPLPERSA